MAEKETNNFRKTMITAAASVVGLSVIATGAAGEAGQRANNEAKAQELVNHNQEVQQAYVDSINEAVNASYDKKALVGEVKINQGDTLGDAGLQLVENALGTDVYNDIKGRIYNPLIDSAKHFNPQAGETYDVVERDINPQDNDGNEYIVVDPSHVIDTEATNIPTPETH